VSSQYFTIDNTRDTVIHTVNGALLAIARNSFSQDKVSLKVKEAYTLPQMILAGLLTESDGRPLKSGGMIFVDAVEKNVSLLKPLGISIPTDSVDKEMQLFTGKEKDGKLNWEDPQPLDTPANDGFEKGRIIFQTNCASCHALNKVLSAPALSGVEGRGPWNSRERLFYFTRHVADYIPRTCYTKELQSQFGSVMPDFPDLDNETLTAIYDYIRNEDRKAGITYSTNYNSNCDDSCYRYDSLLRIFSKAQANRNDLVDANGGRIDYDRKLQTIAPADTSDFIPPVLNVDKVSPQYYQSEYYQFKINSFGWYNIDALAGNNEVELTVETQGEDSISVFLVVPNEKVFAEGGPVRDRDDLFGFYTRDGKINLSLGTEAFVFAMKESGGKIYFASLKFTSVEKQNIILEPKPVSKRQFNRAIKNLMPDNLSIRVQDSKNARNIRKSDKNIKDLQNLLDRNRPKNCNCNCGEVKDTSINQ
jgi:mono/diheme cytochrome c family protein